jgi:hypothetical protein
MIRKEKAAAIARYGIYLVESSFLNFFRASDQKTNAAPYNGINVCGLK